MSAGIEEFTAEFFDGSSRSWMANKIRRGASMVYKCKVTCQTGNPCRNAAVKMGVCKQHSHSSEFAKLKANKDS
jgi:hypothetical protein